MPAMLLNPQRFSRSKNGMVNVQPFVGKDATSHSQVVHSENNPLTYHHNDAKSNHSKDGSFRCKHTKEHDHTKHRQGSDSPTVNEYSQGERDSSKE